MVSIPVLCDCSLRVFIHFDDKTACCLGCGRWCYPGADLFLRFPGKHSGIGYIKDFVKGYKAVFFI